MNKNPRENESLIFEKAQGDYWTYPILLTNGKIIEAKEVFGPYEYAGQNWFNILVDKGGVENLGISDVREKITINAKSICLIADQDS